MNSLTKWLFHQPNRHFIKDRSLGPTLKLSNKLRKNVITDQKIRHGKEIIGKRSEFLEWNYDVELNAFCARIQEDIDDSKLREAFINPSYASAELQRRRSVGLDEESMTMVSNKRLATVGKDIVQDIITKYARAVFPRLPEEGVKAIRKHLTQLDILADVSFLLGTRDLIKSEVYPPARKTYRRTLYALIGAIAESSNVPNAKLRAIRFVIDVIMPQLHAVQDLTQIWDIQDPLGVLKNILKADGRGEPESRLLWASGKDTIMACYHVGIYSDKEIIGQAPGETSEIAEEMAALDALKRLFQIDDSRPPLPFGEDLAKLDIRKKKNVPLEQWSEKKITANIAYVSEK